MDGETPLWIEGLTDEALFAMNDILCDESIRQGFYPGKTETRFWNMYVQIVEECTFRNAQKRKELNV